MLWWACLFLRCPPASYFDWVFVLLWGCEEDPQAFSSSAWYSHWKTAEESLYFAKTWRIIQNKALQWLSLSLSGSLIRGRHKEWTCCSSNRHCAVNSSFGRVESDKGPKAELREEEAWPHDWQWKSKFLSFSWTLAHLKS